MTVHGFMSEDCRTTSPKEISSAYCHSMYCPALIPSVDYEKMPADHSVKSVNVFPIKFFAIAIKPSFSQSLLLRSHLSMARSHHVEFDHWVVVVLVSVAD